METFSFSFGEQAAPPPVAPAHTAPEEAPRAVHTFPLTPPVLPAAFPSLVAPNTYEGGGQSWEGSRDLAGYLRSPEGAGDAARLSRATVLDMGCGVGELAALALQLGAAHVFAQDLNEGVLRGPTSAALAGHSPRVTLVAGAWGDLLRVVGAGEVAHPPLPPLRGVDVVLSAETLYRTASYPTIIALLSTLLTPGTGVALFALKRLYFGVGGGTAAFTQAAHAGGLHVEVVASVADGVSNVRDVIRVRVAARS